MSDQCPNCGLNRPYACVECAHSLDEAPPSAEVARLRSQLEDREQRLRDPSAAERAQMCRHPAWDRVDGRSWAGATRSEMIDVVLEALAALRSGRD